MDPGSLGALSQSGFGSEGNTMSALSESGFGNPSRPSESKYEDDRTIFRPLRPIMEYDPNSDPKNDFGSGIAYEAPVEEEPQHRNLSPALGVSAIVLLASGIYVLTKPSSK